MNNSQTFRTYAFSAVVGVICFVCGGLVHSSTASAWRATQAKGSQLNSYIDSVKAKQWLGNHRTNTGSSKPNRRKFGRTHYFNRTVLEAMLGQKDEQNQLCAGLRFYNGRNEQNEACLFVVSVDSRGRDMVKKEVNKLLPVSYLIGISDDRCPDLCDGSSLLPLNERRNQ